MQGWTGPDGDVAHAVREQNDRLLQTYRADPRRAEQDANIERSVTEGAYARRQLFELIQNAADAMRATRGRCEVRLTTTHLYVANTGEPLSALGARTLMAAHMSTKRDDQIGRFGLGFKSVLAVSDSPMIVSRSGSLRFDRAWAREMILGEVPDATHHPVTRLARPEDPSLLADADPTLRGLMRWATTVVVLPLRSGHDILGNSVRGFPAEFLLFSSQVQKLDLVDETPGGGERSVTLHRDGDVLTLDDGRRRSQWIVSGTKHSPSREALVDGGYQAARDLVSVAWAAPIDGGGRGMGRFWAFFPTAEETTLSGIVNAPWKLADDRASLLPGRFNDELLIEVLPGLIAKAIPKLHSAERQATVIDLLPARGKEARGHADDVINLPVMEAVAAVRSVPTMDGTLSYPRGLRMHPEGLTPEELSLWAAACPDPGRWVSHAVNSPERRAKVTRLGGLANAASGVRPVQLVEWVEHLVGEPTVASSAVAVRLVAQLITRRPELRSALTRARVMLLSDGSLHSCERGSVFLPGGRQGTHHLFIDPALASDPAVASALEVLGIKVLDDVGALRSELSAPRINWQNVWISSRRLSIDEAEKVFRELLGPSVLERLRVQTADGAWRSPNEVLLPGPVVPADMSRDQKVGVHAIFHKQDLELLTRLGLVNTPELRLDPPMETWRAAALADLRDRYRKELGKPRLPDDSIDIETGRVAWPLDTLPNLSLEGRAALLARLLTKLDPDGEWRIAPRAGGRAYRVPDRTWAQLRRYGALKTAIGVQPVTRCLAYDENYAVVDGVAQPLPVVAVAVSDAQARALGLKTDVGDLSAEDWRKLIEQAAPWPMPRRSLVYAWAALCDSPPPTQIRVLQGKVERDLEPASVAVAVSDEIFDSLVHASCPVLRVDDPDDASRLISRWGLADGGDMLTESLDFEATGEPEPLLDRYPPLRLVADLDPTSLSLRLQRCSRLVLLIATPVGEQSRSLPYRVHDGMFLTTADDDAEILMQVGEALNVRLNPESILQRMEAQRRNALRERIAATDDLRDKLVMAVGVESLRDSVPEAALTALGPDPTSRDIAKLAIAVDGYDVLTRHTRALTGNGLNPPSRWAGSRGARDWVRSLGFPTEFAGFAGASRVPELEVQGPPTLGELHDYQKIIAERIVALLDPAAEMRRGLVALPTGAGKTRVAVQALVEHLGQQPAEARIVWVAETDELCEQAVQTWSEVWRAKGAPGRSLMISRLWAGNTATEHADLQVVVASTSKLQSLVDRPQGWADEYGWLRYPMMIVVDEAHRSIGREYTRVLSALGGTNRVVDLVTPLLGLTATPYRGHNEPETRVLADRYHRHLLDEGVFPDNDVYGYLQDAGILAHVKQICLQGASIELTDLELEHVAKVSRLPESFGERLGKDAKRNVSIVESILALPPTTSILLFASSVENARTLAALLSYEGVEARAIAGQTPPGARRRYIDEFRDGRIRVLTNYAVFTEGFDVPKVDAVYVTRPTLSPNVYQQMIGRGLRGPLNGGKEEVLVVNVEDNITNYGEHYAFRHFEHLWDRGR